VREFAARQHDGPGNDETDSIGCPGRKGVTPSMQVTSTPATPPQVVQLLRALKHAESAVEFARMFVSDHPTLRALHDKGELEFDPERVDDLVARSYYGIAWAIKIVNGEAVR
jgi:hypothetical protein